jgi:hypothetical protein
MRGTLPVTVMVGLLMTGCGTANGSGPGTSAQQSPRELYREYVNRLAKVDTKGVCALFTPDGATGYASAYEAGSCEGAVDKAAAAGGDLSGDLELVDTITITQEGDQFASIGSDSCSLGRFIAKKADSGWLFIDHTPQQGSCGG